MFFELRFRSQRLSLLRAGLWRRCGLVASFFGGSPAKEPQGFFQSSTAAATRPCCESCQGEANPSDWNVKPQQAEVLLNFLHLSAVWSNAQVPQETGFAFSALVCVC